MLRLNRFEIAVLLISGSVFTLTASAALEATTQMKDKIVFATYAEDGEELKHCLTFAASVRKFAGSFSEVPIRIYFPHTSLATLNRAQWSLAESLRVTLIQASMPATAAAIPYAGKTFAAAQAEGELVNSSEVLAWFDEDTIVLSDPAELLLSDTIAFAYRPVMHLLIGSLYSQPPDEFWRRVFHVARVPDSSLFPMETVVDEQTIRPYFNAGLIVVRPERGILGCWARCFQDLYSDSVIDRLCAAEQRRRTFLHQVALACAVLNCVRRIEMRELSHRYNYPLFFQEMFGAKNEFDNLTDVVTLRYDAYFRNPSLDWSKRLTGTSEKVSWLRDQLTRELPSR